MKKTLFLIVSGLFLCAMSSYAQEKAADKKESQVKKAEKVQTSQPEKIAISEKGAAKDQAVKPKACCAHGAKNTKGCADKTTGQAHDKNCTMPCCAQKNKEAKDPAN